MQVTWRIPKLQRTSCSKSPAQGARRWCCLTLPSTAPVNHLCFRDGLLYKLRVLYMTQSPQINWPPSTLPTSSNWQNNQFFCIITEWSKAGSYQTIPVLQLLARLTARIHVQIKGLAIIPMYYIVQQSFKLVKMPHCPQRDFLPDCENFCKISETSENLFPLSASPETKI